MPIDPDQIIADAAPDLRHHYGQEIAALKHRATRRRRRRRASAAAVVLIGAVAATGLATLWRETAAPATAPLSITLADGSRIDLDAGAAVELPLAPWRRQARVLRGEVVFDIRHDDHAPFEVRAAALRLTDLGTRFVVRHVADGTTLAVYDGLVQAETTTGLAAVVKAGHAVAIRADAIVPQPLPDETLATSWRDRRLVFRDTRLGDVAARLSRYGQRPVVLGTPAIASLAVNGTFRLDDIDAALATLEQALPIRVLREADRVVLLPRAGDNRPATPR